MRVIGSGRTDSGVHARGQVVHFNAPRKLALRNVVLALNSYLPEDIRVMQAVYTADDFHARFSAVQRHYSYHILRRSTAVDRHFVWTLYDLPDTASLPEYADVFLGEHDFSSFCSAQAEVEHKFCTVSRSEWEVTDQHLIYRISANRFLHSMVRSIVGTMIQLARKGMKVKDLESLLSAKERNPLIFTAPARGLFLEKVDYHDFDFPT